MLKKRKIKRNVLEVSIFIASCFIVAFFVYSIASNDIIFCSAVGVGYACTKDSDCNTPKAGACFKCLPPTGDRKCTYDTSGTGDENCKKCDGSGADEVFDSTGKVPNTVQSWECKKCVGINTDGSDKYKFNQPSAGNPCHLPSDPAGAQNGRCYPGANFDGECKEDGNCYNKCTLALPPEYNPYKQKCEKPTLWQCLGQIAGMGDTLRSKALEGKDGDWKYWNPKTYACKTIKVCDEEEVSTSGSSYIPTKSGQPCSVPPASGGPVTIVYKAGVGDLFGGAESVMKEIFEAAIRDYIQPAINNYVTVLGCACKQKIDINVYDVTKVGRTITAKVSWTISCVGKDIKEWELSVWLNSEKYCRAK